MEECFNRGQQKMRLWMLKLTMRRCLVWLMMFAACTAQSIGNQFEREHHDGVQRNPPGVVLTIETVNGLTYHLSDAIKYRLLFTSKERGTYTVEVMTGQSEAGSSDDLVISAPGIDTPIHSRQRVPFGIVCCDSDRRYLSQKPIVTEFALTMSRVGRSVLDPNLMNTHRDIKPGGYAVFMQTRSVFRGLPKSNHDKYLSPSDAVITSQNVLHITILPDVPSSGSGKP
jgi:hypothetical protein